ncbi:MAG: hypothetical protein ACMUIU_13335 [bacterium]
MKRFRKKGFWVLYVAIFLAGAFIIVALGLQNQSNGIPDVNAQEVRGIEHTPNAYTFPGDVMFVGDVIFSGASFPGDIIRDSSGGMRTIMTCRGCSQTMSTCEWQCGPTFSQCGTRGGQGSTIGICTGTGISTISTCSGGLFGSCGGGTTLTCSSSLFGCGGGTMSTCGGSLFGCGGGTSITCSSSLFGCGGGTTLTCSSSLFGCGGGTMSTCGSSLFGCGGGTILTCSGSLFGCDGGTMFICDGNTRGNCPDGKFPTCTPGGGCYCDTCAPGGGCYCDGAYLRTRNLTQSPAY